MVRDMIAKKTCPACRKRLSAAVAQFAHDPGGRPSRIKRLRKWIKLSQMTEGAAHLNATQFSLSGLSLDSPSLICFCWSVLETRDADELPGQMANQAETAQGN